MFPEKCFLFTNIFKANLGLVGPLSILLNGNLRKNFRISYIHTLHILDGEIIIGQFTNRKYDQ